MDDADSTDQVRIAHEVNKISHDFLYPRGFAYFQFKRIYKDSSYVILANLPVFFEDFLKKEKLESSPYIPPCTRQTAVFFWDESFSQADLSFVKDQKGIYHGLTLISRRREFYDCITFAMASRHPYPFAYYFHILKELQKFAGFFLLKGHKLIEKASQNPARTLENQQGQTIRSFFLPKRSNRFRIGKDTKDYITTYEALCVQLLEEGKSYKEIASLLSMAPSTVETHLKRLKARTGLTLQELTLQSFHPYNNKKLQKIF